MHELVISGKMRLALREKNTPKRAADQVALKILQVGVCGGDVRNLYKGLAQPFCHEYVANVIQAPPSHQQLLGKQIIGMNSVACGNCKLCKSDLPKECKDKWLLCISAAADYINVPINAIYTPAKEMCVDLATLVEPLAASISNLKAIDSQLQSIESIAIFGTGTMAFMTRKYINLLEYQEDKSPKTVIVYSMHLLRKALDTAAPGACICICYTPTDFYIDKDLLIIIRNKLLQILFVVASPNECFAEAEKLLHNSPQDYNSVIGLKADFRNPEQILNHIQLNTQNGKKTILVIDQMNQRTG